MSHSPARTLMLASLLCLGLSGTASALDKDASFPPLMPLATSVSDLDLDTTFNPPFGSHYYDPVSAAALNSDDQLLRVYSINEQVAFNPPRFEKYYYILAKHLNISSTTGVWTRDAVIVKVDAAGQRVTSFGSNGVVRYQGTTWDDIRDAVVEDSVFFGPSRAYFAGSIRWPGTDLNMAVACVDLTTGGTCSGFGVLGTAFIPFDIGGTKNDMATRIEYDPEGFLFISGYADAAAGKQLAVAKLKVADGNVSGDFGVAGKLNFDLGAGSIRDNNVYTSMLTTASSPGGKRLVIAGNYRKIGTDYDGYVMSLAPTGGAAPRVGKIAYELDNTGAKDDAITAIGQTHGGQILYAGWSQTDDAGYDAVIFGALDNVGMTYDPRMCGGTGCVKSAGSPLFNGDKGSWPYAILERPGNYDLILAIQAQTRGITAQPPQPPYSWKQVIRQYGSSGNTLHAEQWLTFTSSSSMPIPAAYPRTLSLDGSKIVVGGMRKWSETSGIGDFDLTLARLQPNDSIFAHHFGSSGGD